jgi:Fe-S-cluster-containing dehydrogenase component
VDEKTGWVKINPMKCIGCKTCIYACPVSMPWFNKDHKIAMKCDFCDPVRDGKPICAEFCSPRALEVVTREEAWVFFRERCLQGEE